MKTRGWILIAIAASALALAGCSEKQGAAGPAGVGATGATGADGAVGPVGPPGPLYTTANEACDVCHGDGKIADVKATTGGVHAAPTDNRILVETKVTAVSVTSGVPTVTVSVTCSAGCTNTPPAGVTITPAAVGGVVAGLAGTNANSMRFTLAHLGAAGPGTNVDWVSDVSRQAYNNATVGVVSQGWYQVALGSSSAPANTGAVLTEVTGPSGNYTFAFGANNGLPEPLAFPSYTGAAVAAVPASATSTLGSTATYRVGTQVSMSASATNNTAAIASISNGWADFTPPASAGAATIAASGPLTPSGTPARELVQTANCNTCHASTVTGFAAPVTGLQVHGGGRRTVEFCVTCHNPSSTDHTTGNIVDAKVMYHKLHYGKNLPSVQAGGTYKVASADYSLGGFPQDIGNCVKCHTGGAQSTNWYNKPTIATCTSCHDTTTFGATGATHTGGSKTDVQCLNCHTTTAPGTGVKIDIAGDIVPTQVAHRMATIYAETPKYVYILGTPTYTATTGVLSVPYSVTYSGTAQDLTATTTDWSQTTSGASRLAINLGWKGKGEADYTNVGNGSLTTPASALSFDGLKVGTPAAPKSQTVSGVTATISGDTSTSFVYTLKVTLPSAIQAMGTGIVFMDGHPAQNLGGTAVDRIPVLNVYKEFAIKDSSASKRRAPVVAVANCKNCHTVLSLHGNNRTDEPVVCTVCHNTANTDIARRPAAGGADGLAEQAIDFKFLIHRIHAGRDTTAGGITVYGFGGSKNVFAGEFPPGNRLNNCENCHATAPLTYKGPMPYQLPLVTGIFGTTISTSKTVTDPSDDLNISPQAALCSGCHDNGIAKTHIQVMGGAFGVLQKDINY